jgi:hypothetical protein
VTFRADFLADAPAHIRGTSLWSWQQAIEGSRKAAAGGDLGHAAWLLGRAAAVRRQMAKILACPRARQGLVAP